MGHVTVSGSSPEKGVCFLASTGYTSAVAPLNQPDKQQVEALGVIVSQIVAVPTDKIQSFVSAHRLQQLYGIIASVGIGSLPRNKLNVLTSSANQTLQLLRSIEGLVPADVPNRTQLETQSQVEYENQFDRLASCIALFQVQAGRLETFNRSATEALGRVQSIESQSQAALDDLKKKIDVAEQAAETSALSTYASYFDKESESHKKAAWGWLAATVGGFGATGYLAYWLWVHFGVNPDPPLTTAQGVQLTVMKVVVLSTAFTLAVACSRIYRSHRHNFIVNRHRRNALRTFQAFANAPEADAQTKRGPLGSNEVHFFTAGDGVYILRARRPALTNS